VGGIAGEIGKTRRVHLRGSCFCSQRRLPHGESSWTRCRNLWLEEHGKAGAERGCVSETKGARKPWWRSSLREREKTDESDISGEELERDSSDARRLATSKAWGESGNHKSWQTASARTGPCRDEGELAG
jgi:hypothetical protein